tara:strand:- start:196 stop:753 length:558 start_codon:yes stop_codon:yes gene_type:complete
MLNVKTIQAITKHAKADTKVASLMTLVMDGFIADKVSLEYFKSPKKDADKVHVEFFSDLNKAIIASFTATERRLITCPVKSLEAGNKPGQKGADGKTETPAKGTRRYIQSEIGAKRNDYQRALDRRLNPKPAKGADDKRTDDKTFCLERATQMLKRLEKAEGATFDVVEALHHIVQLSKILNTKV